MWEFHNFSIILPAILIYIAEDYGSCPLSMVKSRLIWRKVTHAQSCAASPRWIHRSIFASVGVILTLHPVAIRQLCMDMTWNVLALQLKAANMAGCVTGPLEKGVASSVPGDSQSRE